VPALDGLITFEPRGLIRSGFDLLKMVPVLRRLQPDLVLDFEQFLRITPILANLSGALQSVGFKTGGQARDALYNVKVPYRKNRHMSLSFGDIIRSSGISTQGLAPLEVPRCPEAAARALARVRVLEEEGGLLVVLHPGSGDNFPGRRWPAEHFGALARRLVNETGARCVLTGTNPERALGAACERAAGVELANAIGRLDLLAFIELIARADLLVTNDTAPAHIGSALHTPLIAIYGPNTPELYGPLHEKSRVFYNRLPCSPCLTNLNAKTSRCRIPSCILNIDPNEIFQAALELLASGKTEEAGRLQGGVS
jgi:ADP-heptose:LPS heptosyltransferase